MDNRPVGVFDSGLGGLTAVRELRRLLPNEDIVYFGDTGRCPYGTKGRVTIERFAAQDIRFLLGFNVKVIVIACNTVSSVALEMASEMSPVPVVGVIESAARAASAATKSGKIGVLGTFTTITSGRYEQALHALQPSLTVTGRACPMFVPLVENGYFGRDCRVAEIIAHEYLDELRGTVDTLILGCTHYPILKGMIADIMGDGVALIDTGRETAMEAARLLEHRGLLKDGGDGSARFFVSDRTDDFARLAAILLGSPIENVGLVKIDQY